MVQPVGAGIGGSTNTIELDPCAAFRIRIGFMDHPVDARQCPRLTRPISTGRSSEPPGSTRCAAVLEQESATPQLSASDRVSEADDQAGMAPRHAIGRELWASAVTYL